MGRIQDVPIVHILAAQVYPKTDVHRAYRNLKGDFNERCSSIKEPFEQWNLDLYF